MEQNIKSWKKAIITAMVAGIATVVMVSPSAAQIRIPLRPGSAIGEGAGPAPRETPPEGSGIGQGVRPAPPEGSGIGQGVRPAPPEGSGIGQGASPERGPQVRRFQPIGPRIPEGPAREPAGITGPGPAAPAPRPAPPRGNPLVMGPGPALPAPRPAPRPTYNPPPVSPPAPHVAPPRDPIGGLRPVAQMPPRPRNPDWYQPGTPAVDSRVTVVNSRITVAMSRVDLTRFVVITGSDRRYTSLYPTTQPEYWDYRYYRPSPYWSDRADLVRSAFDSPAGARVAWYHYDWWTDRAPRTIPTWHYTWAAANYSADYWWMAPRWSDMARWFPWQWTQPVCYEYGAGGNVVYRNGRALMYGIDIGPIREYAYSAANIASFDPAEMFDATYSDEIEWLPLGTFAMVSGTGTTGRQVVPSQCQSMQLAVSRRGVVSGSFYDPRYPTQTFAVTGRFDRRSQRVAFTVQGLDGVVFETGAYNLTQDETPVLLHTGAMEMMTCLLVRLDEPCSRHYTPAVVSVNPTPVPPPSRRADAQQTVQTVLDIINSVAPQLRQ